MGLTDGSEVGATVGLTEYEGATVGSEVGDAVGFGEGEAVGEREG